MIDNQIVVNFCLETEKNAAFCEKYVVFRMRRAVWGRHTAL